MPVEKADPKLFYKGYSLGWGPIQQNLDVRRRSVDTILSTILEPADPPATNRPRFIVVTGHAGSGKSTILKRTAWDAAASFEALCLHLGPHGALRFDVLRELCQLLDERVYVFIDKLGEHVSGLTQLLSRLERTPLPVTIIGAERTNEWNLIRDSLGPFVDEEFHVPYLSEREIEDLLNLLERHGSLGALAKLPYEDRVKALEERHGRQLLVALHEATAGRPYEDIVVDEYQTLISEQAKLIYLSVCTLNQFDAPVRAGIIARLYGISFTEFREKFFLPLEQVVIVGEDSRVRDYVYVARHPHVAEMLVDRVLANGERRVEMYVDIVRALNIDFDSDRCAFRRMVRARSLLELVGYHELIERFYVAAETVGADDYHFLHQRGIYEIQRPNGNLSRAEEYLSRAREKAPWDTSITHSFAELQLRRAEEAKSVELRDLHLRHARTLAMGLTGKLAKSAAGYHTLAKIGIFRLKNALEHPDELTDRVVSQILTETEGSLQEGLQVFPEDPYLLEAESRINGLLAVDSAAQRALLRAFEAHPENSFIALRLARNLQASGNTDAAVTVLQKSLQSGARDKKLHYYLGCFLEESGNTDSEIVGYHLRRGFIEGDRNYEAQYRYARWLYLQKRAQDASQIFNRLRESRVNPIRHRKIIHPIANRGELQTFSGTISRLESAYGFVVRDGIADSIFFHSSDIDSAQWGLLSKGRRVTFNIGFTWSGPKAFNVMPE